jgi:hypothetical protein
MELKTRMDNSMNTPNTVSLEPEFSLKSREEPRLTVWTLIWAGFWTGVLLCGFVLVMR